MRSTGHRVVLAAPRTDAETDPNRQPPTPRRRRRVQFTALIVAVLVVAVLVAGGVVLGVRQLRPASPTSAVAPVVTAPTPGTVPVPSSPPTLPSLPAPPDPSGGRPATTVPGDTVSTVPPSAPDRVDELEDPNSSDLNPSELDPVDGGTPAATVDAQVAQAVSERVARTLREDVALRHPQVAAEAASVAEAFERDRGLPSVWPSEVPPLTGSAVLATRFDGRVLTLTATAGASFAQIVRELTVGFDARGQKPVVAAGTSTWRAMVATGRATVAVSVDDRSPLASPAQPVDPAQGLLHTISIVVVYDQPQFPQQPTPLP